MKPTNLNSHESSPIREENNEKEIKRLSSIVLAQVVLFILAYITSIVIGGVLIYLAFHASIWLIPQLFESVFPEITKAGRLGFLLFTGIGVAILGLWVFLFTIGIYLVKPLFIFPKRNKRYGREIKREDAPQLYDMIMETADAVGVKKPKHIYVNQDVNACVFFNTGFWNIFFPVKKNLAIGLGLFQSTNIEEIRSVIAHEFGHFAQSSMRVGSVLYIANKVITDLVYRRDKLDSWMLSWCLKSGIWGFWGKATKLVVIKFRKITESLYKRHQRNYMKLSRQMEYDADAASCKLVGKTTFTSALYKIQQNSKAFDTYNHLLDTLTRQGETISNYWEGFEIMRPLLKKAGLDTYSYDEIAESPSSSENNSKVAIEEIGESHPSIDKRIQYAPEIVIDKPNNGKKVMAWHIIPASLSNALSKEILNKMQTGNDPFKEISRDEFKILMDERISSQIYPEELEPYFNRSFLWQGNEEFESEPLSENNRKIIIEYETAIRDWELLKAIEQGKIPVKNFMYDGKSYNVNAVPLAQHRRYVKALEKKVRMIDEGVRRLAVSKAEDPALILAAYEAISYSQKIIERLSKDFLPVRDEIINELNEANIAGENDFRNVMNWLDSYEIALKDVLKTLKYYQLRPFIRKEIYEHMIGFIDAQRSFRFGINSVDVNHMFWVTDWILNAHNQLIDISKKVIVNTLIEQSLPDTTFLDLWNTRSDLINTSDENSLDKNAVDHVVLSSNFGQLDLAIPTDDEIDEVYYNEIFRRRLHEFLFKVEKIEDFTFEYVTTVPLREEEDGITCVNPEDEKKLACEIEEYNKFMDNLFGELNWEAISEAANQGSIDANAKMADYFLKQNHLHLAFDAAMKGAMGENTECMAILGELDLIGKDTHPERAVKLFKCAAFRGSARGLCNLGKHYIKGEGIAQDEERAFKLFLRSALQGLPLGEYLTGKCLLNGIGTQTDRDKGLYWLYRSANQGNEEAVNMLWKHHKEMDEKEQYVEIVRKGAAKGIKECCNELAEINAISTLQNHREMDYSAWVNNPMPVFDTSLDSDVCTVCGKSIPSHTSVCPHCKERIWEEDINDD